MTTALDAGVIICVVWHVEAGVAQHGGEVRGVRLVPLVNTR